MVELSLTGIIVSQRTFMRFFCHGSSLRSLELQQIDIGTTTAHDPQMVTPTDNQAKLDKLALCYDVSPRVLEVLQSPQIRSTSSAVRQLTLLASPVDGDTHIRVSRDFPALDRLSIFCDGGRSHHFHHLICHSPNCRPYRFHSC
jgi:hypothetical protein